MYDIVHELTIAASPPAVYDAVTTEAGLSRWWASRCSAQPVVGSEATFAFEDQPDVLTMRVDLLEAPELVHWDCIGGPDEWVGTKVAFRIEGIDADDDGVDDGKSVVRFWHGGWEYENGLLPRCSFQWAMHLDNLRRFLENGNGSN